jgi:arylsulfatase
LLTGRNHHSVGMGNIAEPATSALGNSSIWPNTAVPLAKIVQLNGYSTAQFGKCHEVPVWETSPMGPYRQWPTGMGFEYFYGFLGGETNQYYPALYEGITPVEPEKSPEEGYSFNDDLTAKATKWIRQQKALMPDKPFFAYYAPGATHAPHHVPHQWSDRYAGQFDEGWDKVREETVARQKELGVIPADCELTVRSADAARLAPTRRLRRPSARRRRPSHRPSGASGVATPRSARCRPNADWRRATSAVPAGCARAGRRGPP